MPKLLRGLGVWLVLALAGFSEDWPQWRGPDRDAVWKEPGLPKRFPPGGLAIRWRAAIGGGHSSPIVADGRVYVTDWALEKPKASERVLCFDEHTGERLWTYAGEIELPAGFFDSNNKPGPDLTPLVSEGLLVNMGATGNLTCLEAKSGRLLWRRELGKDYELNGFAELTPCPLVEAGLVIAVIGGRHGACIVALDLHTGKEVWRALDDPYTFSSPIVITAAGKRQLIVWTPRAVNSLDPATGKLWWREELTTREDFVVATPVCLGDLLLISGLMLRLDSAKPGASILWPESRAVSKRVLSNMCTPLIFGDAVYAEKTGGHFVCLDAQTGEALWDCDKVTVPKSGATIHATVNGGTILLFTDEGDLIRAHLTRSGYDELSRVHLIDPTFHYGKSKVVWAPPAFADRHVFARNDKELICASLNN